MNPQNIAERITAVRGKLSRRVFSDMLNIQENTLRNYEKGLSLPNSEIIANFCTVFSITPNWLLFGKGEMYETEANKSNAPSSAVQSVPASPAALGLDSSLHHACVLCADLRQELSEERLERRELAKENRELWKENAALRERSARLEAHKPNTIV